MKLFSHQPSFSLRFSSKSSSCPSPHSFFQASESFVKSPLGSVGGKALIATSSGPRGMTKSNSHVYRLRFSMQRMLIQTLGHRAFIRLVRVGLWSPICATVAIQAGKPGMQGHAAEGDHLHIIDALRSR